MTATHGGGREDDSPDKDTVYTMKTGFKNDGYQHDRYTNDDIVKPPPLLAEDDNFASGKVKLSRNEKWRILKNIAVSAAFMIQFTAFQVTANFQSSINARDGLVFSSGIHTVSASKENASKALLDTYGANFCMIGGSHHYNQNLVRPPDSEIYESSAIYLTCVAVAVIMVAFLVDPLLRYGEKQRSHWHPATISYSLSIEETKSTTIDSWHGASIHRIRLHPGRYGVLFRRNKEVAFSNYRLWESAGFVIAYAYSTHLCARKKLYVMMVTLLIGVAGYIVVEILHKRKPRRLKAIAEDPVVAAEAAKEPPEEDDEKDEIDDDLIITHL